MTSKKLTYEQHTLLHKLHDGELEQEQEAFVKKLVARSEQAQGVMDALAELEHATCVAEEEIWDAADVQDATIVAENAQNATSVLDRSLEDLVPLLERFHDQEASDEELEEIDLLLQNREDVADYLASLEEIHLGTVASHEAFVDAHVEQVDFSGFWGNLSARLDEEEQIEEEQGADIVAFPGQKASTAERPSFNLDDHRVMLYRHFDGEASAEEEAQVQAWAEIDPEVAVTIEALEELNLAVNAAIELVQERQDFTPLWDGIASALGDELNERNSDTSGAAVISFEKEKEKRSVWTKYRRELFVAAAAALLAVTGVNLLQGPRQVVVEKTVVIVESVENSSPDTSVMVTGPMQSASMEVDSSDAKTDQNSATNQEDEEPTVIWLIDNMNDDEPAADENPVEEPSKKDAPKQPAKKNGSPKGQPI